MNGLYLLLGNHFCGAHFLLLLYTDFLFLSNKKRLKKFVWYNVMKLISLFLVLFLWSIQCSSMKFDVVCVKKHPYDILIKSVNVKRDKTLMNQCFISFLFWRRHPDSNRGSEFCRLVPYHLAMSPNIIIIYIYSKK